MKRVSLADRLRYEFDNTMARGPIALIGWLAFASLLFVLIVSVVVYLAGLSVAPDTPQGLSFAQIVWLSLMHEFDPSNIGNDAGGAPFIAAMLVVTLGGLFIVSTLIGVLTSGVQDKIMDLRKGRSFVVEENHTLILGWSAQIFIIISELVQANSNQARACIVILADKDKVEMEDEIRGRIPHPGHTRIVCRSGNPLDPTDLEIVNPHATKSIIILSPPVGDPDTHTVKTMLAVTNNPRRRSEPYHIVAEIREEKNMDVARMVGKEEAQLVLVADLISRITVQTCRQSGLSVVYTELLNFGGDEIYFKREPSLAGKIFGEALLGYEDSTVVGLARAGGQIVLNPAMETRIAADDQIIAISRDDDTIQLSGLSDYGIQNDAIQSPSVAPPSPERTLILGWNERAPTILRELDNYVAPGSATTVVANVPGAQARIRALDLRNQQVSFCEGETTDRAVLDALEASSFDHMIVLSYSDTNEPQEADAQTLITLLHLRDMSEKSNKPFSIVSEMRDVRNRELAEVTRADDFIVSDHLVSLMLAQVSENKYLSAVFADLFDAEGSEVYLRPAQDYIRLGVPINFYTVLESARCRNQVALGYRLRRDAHDANMAYGVVVNPRKSNMITFDAGDKVIVLAQS